MTALLFLALSFTYLCYYGVKGIILKSVDTRLSFFTITAVFWLLTIWFSCKLFSGWILFIMITYLIISFAEYMGTQMMNRKCFLLPKHIRKMLFGYVYVDTEEVIVNFTILKLPVLFLLNLMLFILERRWVAYSGGLEVDVQTRTNEHIIIQF